LFNPRILRRKERDFAVRGLIEIMGSAVMRTSAPSWRTVNLAKSRWKSSLPSKNAIGACISAASFSFIFSAVRAMGL